MKMRLKKEPGVLYIRGIPTDLKNRFHGICTASGRTMTQVITHLMQQEVDSHYSTKKEGSTCLAHQEKNRPS